MTPIDTAIESYNAQLQLPERDRLSLRQIASDNGVLPGTLSKRLSGQTLPRSQAHAHRQALRPDEELALVEYIRRMSSMGHPPPPYMIYEIAHELIKNRILLSPLDIPPLPSLSHTWLDHFKRHHPEVLSVWSRTLDTSRLNAEDPAKLAPWFAEYGAMLSKHAYPPSLIFNMDETGFGIGTTQSTRVLTVMETGQKAQKAKKASPGRQEWVTSIECVSAAGFALPPLLIYKGTGTMNSGWLPKDVDSTGWAWTSSSSGWTNNTLGYEWLTNIFEPQTRPPPLTPPAPPTRRLLIADGHGSHLQARFISFCMRNSIDLMILPAHSSHRTQPLDVGIFGPMKGHMSRLASEAARIYGGRIQKTTWAAQLVKARSAALTEKNIQVGWRETGLYPFAPTKLVPVVEPPSLPPPSTPPQPPTPLASIQSQNRDFIWHHGSIMTTPIKRHLISLADGYGASQTEVSMLRMRLRDAEAAQNVQKRARKGISVSNLGTFHITTDNIHAQVMAAEASRAAKKRKGKAKAVRADSQDPTEDLAFIQSHMDQN